MLGMTENQTIILTIIFNLLSFCTFCSIICLFSVFHITAKLKAMELSTHTIEYRDPTENYDDELDLIRDFDGKMRHRKPEEEEEIPEEQQDMDKLNKSIENGDVII